HRDRRLPRCGAPRRRRGNGHRPGRGALPAARPGAAARRLPAHPRELEVLEAMAEGLSNRGIAERLFLSLSTVEKAISAIFDKLDLTGDEQTSRRVQAVLRYLDER